MYKIRVWDMDTLIFEGYSKRIRKEGQNFQAWTVGKDGNGDVQKAEYSTAKYSITYEDTKV